MQTPKEKANRLVADFIKHSRAEKDIKPIQSAKQCALIAVDEILEICRLERDWYWEEVKTEIEKL
jgi:hypothetical protein